MADATLLEMLKEVRWKTLKLLEGVDDVQARFTGAEGLNNSILWHAGHALIVVEQLGLVNAAGLKPEWPEGWFEKFSWSSKPGLVTEWPRVEEVVAKLKDQRDRLAKAIEGLSAERLDTVIGAAPRNRTVRGEIVHGLHDEAQHQGEMYLLKKLWKGFCPADS